MQWKLVLLENTDVLLFWSAGWMPVAFRQRLSTRCLRGKAASFVAPVQLTVGFMGRLVNRGRFI